MIVFQILSSYEANTIQRQNLSQYLMKNKSFIATIHYTDNNRAMEGLENFEWKNTQDD